MAIDKDPVAAVGRAVRDLRTTIGWTQRHLATRAGVSQPTVCAVERGRIRNLTFGAAAALLGAMGARLIPGVDAPYLGDRSRQREPAHGMVVAAVARRLRADGWEVRTEVEVGGDRSRGWVDLLAMHRAHRVLLVIEVKTEIRDLGAIERTLSWYEREAWRAARRAGWAPRRALGCLLLLATEANDHRVGANRESFDSSFPLRARHLAGLIDAGVEPIESSGGTRAVAMVDPRSRRRVWCRPLRIDGRRSAAPYADYADFMRSVELGRRAGRLDRADRADRARRLSAVVVLRAEARAPSTRSSGASGRGDHAD